MSEYNKHDDYSYQIGRLQVSCVGAPFEVQLLWMFEICVLLCYLYGRSTTRAKISTSPHDANTDVTFAKHLGIYAEQRLCTT